MEKPAQKCWVYFFSGRKPETLVSQTYATELGPVMVPMRRIVAVADWRKNGSNHIRKNVERGRKHHSSMATNARH